MLEQLAAFVGAENVLTSDEALAQASRSWFPPHLKTRPTLFSVVVRPGSSDEVAAVAAWATASGTALAVVGGGTGTGERETAVLGLDTTRLSALSWSEEDLSVTAGAGVTLATIEQQLAGHGYTLGQAIGSANLATVGGCIATDAVGLFSGKYGRFRESVLRQTSIGGILTEATLAMYPQPEARAWAVFRFPSLSDAVDALRLVYRSDARPALARASLPRPLPSPFSSFVGEKGGESEGWVVVLAFEGDEGVQTGHYQLAYAICQQLGGTPASPDDGERWLEQRERSDFWSANAQPDTWADFVRVPARWSELKETLAVLSRQLEGRVAHFQIEVAHPTPHGATLEVAFTLRGDERRYREMRALLVAP